MAVINVPFDSSLDTTFIVDFTEFVPVYNGLKKVWIGDGTTYDPDNGSGGTAGYLYAKYYDGMNQGIGFVSDYEAVKNYFESHGIVLEYTYEQWVELLSTVSDKAVQAQLWATGHDDQEYTLGSSAREFAEDARSSAASCTAQINEKLNEMNTAIDRANTSSSRADTSTSRANTAAQALENLEANATTLESFSEATAEVDLENGHYVLNLGIPKGDTDYLCAKVQDETLYFAWTSDRAPLDSRAVYYNFDSQDMSSVYDKLQPITNAEIDALFT